MQNSRVVPSSSVSVSASRWRAVVATAGLALAGVLGGCSFDASALAERVCTTIADCSDGQVCSGGICVSPAVVDGDTNLPDLGLDTDLPDAPQDGEDTGDIRDADGPELPPTCEPSSRTCQGDLLLVCGPSGTLLSSDNCAAAGRCPAPGCLCQDGACVPRICAPGQTSCQDNEVVRCAPDGLSFDARQTCDTNQRCTDGVCRPTACIANTITCDGESLVTCGAAGVVTDVTDCASQGAWCDARLSPPTCVPQACVPATRRCITNELGAEVVEVCDDRGTQYEVLLTCDAASICDDGRCVPRVCTPGRTGCLDFQTVGTCDERGGAFEPTTCATGTVCVNDGTSASCISQICAPGSSRCDGTGTLETCSSDGLRYERTTCGSTSYCSDGSCVARICTPGTLICVDDFTLGRCDTLGSQYMGEPCGAGRYCGDTGSTQCRDGVCEAGTLRCGGDGRPERCRANGSGWDRLSACPAGQTCDEGSCAPVICTPAQTRCADARTTEVCNALGTAYDALPCPASNYCAEGACEPEVCTPDAVRCLNSSTRGFCDDIGSTETPTPCPGGTFCNDGTCSDQVCVPNRVDCADGFTRRTCNTDGSATTTTACPANNFCADGSYNPQVCTPLGTTCLDERTRGVCNANGSTQTAQTCGDGTYCSGGACVPQICTPGQRDCVDDFRYTECNATGSTVLNRTCSAGRYCDGGLCPLQTCTPGVSTCPDRATLSTCNTAGSTATTTTCPSATVCLTNACVPQICTAGAARCGAGGREVCNTTGTAWEASPCTPGQTCTGSGVCQTLVCTPSTNFCDGLQVRTCNGAGTGSSAGATCSFRCDAGVCVDPFCGDGIVSSDLGEQCDDGNANACDGCNGCVRNNGLGIAPGTVTTSNASWVPGTSNFTVELWTSATAAGVLAGLGEFTPGTSDFDLDHTWLSITPEGQASFRVALGGTDVLTVTGGPNLLNTGWHHVAGVRSGNRSLLLFVDGRLVAANGFSGSNTSLDNNGRIFVGSRNVTPAYGAATATIDGFRISSVARYGTGFTPVAEPAVDGSTIAQYLFNESGGTGVTSAPAGRNLTVSGSTRVADTCFGRPTAARCGDGVVAPWERCDGGVGCADTCVWTCSGGEMGPFETCYAFGNDAAGARRNWTNARAICTGLSGDLVTIESALENLWLRARLGNSGNFWLGLNDQATEGTFVWASGSTAPYRNWGASEPNDFGVGGEDCVILINNGSWNDTGCGDNRGYICEF